MLVNTWFGTGRLGRDPEMSYTPGGKAYTRFSIAVSQGKDQPAMWLNIVAWEKLAEQVNERFFKGDEVFIQGRLTMRPYKDKSGVDRVAFEVVASVAQLTQKPKMQNSDSLGDPDEHFL